MHFENATREHFAIAELVCSAMSKYVPRTPEQVEIAIEGDDPRKVRHAVMRISFGYHGLELVVALFAPAGCEHWLVASIRQHLQPLGSILRVLQLRLSYEELSQALEGSGLLTIMGTALGEYMSSDMSDELKALLEPEAQRVLGYPVEDHSLRVHRVRFAA